MGNDELGQSPEVKWDLVDGDGYLVERFSTRDDAEFEANRLTLKYDLDIWDPFTGEAKYPWYKVIETVLGSDDDLAHHSK